MSGLDDRAFGQLGAAFFQRPAEQVARDLIGVTLLVDGVGGTIVETEAYDSEDPASHSFRGPTPRNAVMFGPAGHVYVYRIYGLHWCLNFTVGLGAAVLIRALRPETGLEAMRARRRGVADRLLCAGPGRLCEALAVEGAMNGHSLMAPPFELRQGEARPAVVASRRIGLSVGVDTLWRFSLSGSPYLSKPVPAER
ncbi:MAG TPA: DNA-3-methyladenine glycosylase [Sphingobium sp.]|uniref:DNA-3-methyladenine glycosylase n=1 Tax=Sphingobium sp. TaxID=1912891 RepID=UPI002ED3CDFA